MRYIGAAAHAMVEQKDNTNRPAMKPPSVGEVAVTIAPTRTPMQPPKMAALRPFQSHSQIKGAAAIWPTQKMANTMPVPELPSGGR